ncbi:MAG: hypothetical protein J6J38_03755 [Lachnospiraceae bacterium]|nr:hypothetical protein [Lachnospiraceae bacterium]
MTMKDRKKLYWEIGLGFLGILVFLWLWDAIDMTQRLEFVERFNAWVERKAVSYEGDAVKWRQWNDFIEAFREKHEWKFYWGAFEAEDLWQIKRWFGTLLVFSVGFFPLSAFLFRKFSDKGYIFGKVLGLVVSGWLVWVLSCLHIVKFSVVGSWVILGLCIVANYGLAIFFCRKKKIKLGEFFGITDGSAVITKAIWYEVLFFIVFIGLLYVKCFRPDFSWQTEGAMDYGFMISMLKSDYMPPEDFWYAGTDLNYYYLGQYFYTYVTKVSGVTVEVAYNLALMTIGAFCVVLCYSLAARILEQYMIERTDEYGMLGKKTVASVPVLRQILPRFAGFLAGFGVTFACSNHYWLYQKLAPAICDILGIDGDHSYWISDPTRYIGWQGEALDQTIHEFPSYSLVLGDVHAHVTNIVFVITLLALLFAFLLERRNRMKRAVAGEIENRSYLREILHPQIIALSFFIGIFQMTNYWDFPIYYVVCGAVILVSNAVVYGFTKKSLLLTAVHAAEFIVIAFVTALMFTVHFDSMAQGIGICNRHTEPYQMIVVWGLPIVAVIAYLVTSIKEEQKRRAEGVSATEHKNVFFAWLQNLKSSDLFLLVLGLCAIGLVLVPELIYVKDIYGEVNQRTNTMFKFAYQAFILFGLVSGCIIVRFLFLPKSGKQFVGGALMFFLLTRNLEYFPYACESWMGDYKDHTRYVSLSIMDNNSDIPEEDMAAVEWIKENLEGRPTILEAHGTSYRSPAPDYTVYNRISALTGCPTIIGWHTHEWLWKGDVNAVNARGEIVEAIYTGVLTDETVDILTEYGMSADSSVTKEVAAILFKKIGVDSSAYIGREMALSLLKEYDVDYLYVGEAEQIKYKDKCKDGVLDYDYLRSLGEVVYEDESDSEFVQTFIVKIK